MKSKTNKTLHYKLRLKFQAVVQVVEESIFAQYDLGKPSFGESNSHCGVYLYFIPSNSSVPNFEQFPSFDHAGLCEI